MRYIGKNVVLSGDIQLGNNVSIWHNAVLRADTAAIQIGDESNIQDLVMMHAGDGYPIRLGIGVSVGHSAILHGCTIGDHVIVGMGAIVMNNSVVGDNSIIAAGSLLSENKTYPSNSLILGSPAKVIRPLTDAEIQKCHANATHYINMAKLQLDQG